MRRNSTLTLNALNCTVTDYHLLAEITHYIMSDKKPAGMLHAYKLDELPIPRGFRVSHHDAIERSPPPPEPLQPNSQYPHVRSSAVQYAVERTFESPIENSRGLEEQTVFINDASFATQTGSTML